MDEEGAFKDQSALTLNRHNEAPIQAEQTEEGKEIGKVDQDRYTGIRDE